MNRAKKLVKMVVPDIIKVTNLEEICEENLKLLESCNSVNEHDYENWAVDENGKEVDLNVYYDNSVTLYVWHEANGGVSANEFISCIVDFIMNLNKDIEQVTLISDGCNYQNRNKSLASPLRLLSKEKNVDIEQLFLCKGHIMMEVDSVHSTLEHYFKPPLYSPSDYITRMRMARPNQPYNVKVLDYTFFKNYDAMCDIISLRPGKKTGDKVVTDLCQLKYSASSQNIQYKTDFNDDWDNLPITTKNQETAYSKSTRSKTAATTSKENVQIKILSDVSNLYTAQLPITKAKYDDLQSLKQAIEKDYHSFYDNLKYTEYGRKTK